MKRLFAFFLSLVMLFSLTACGENSESMSTEAPSETTIAPETDPPFDLASYKELVSSCTDTMAKNTTLLSIVALYEQNYWEASMQLSGTVTSEKLVIKGMEYLAENTDYTEANITSWHESIMDFYKEIVSTDISGAEADSISELFNEFFDAYLCLYKLATSPSGDFTDFVDSYKSYTGIIENCKTKIEVLLS